MPIQIFLCYAHEDEALLKTLINHLRPLQRQGLIDTWHDRDISAGTEWESQINQRLNTADIILLLLSSDFIASDYCYSKEMKQALERHEHKEACVIPIILRPVYWQGILGNLQALPKDAIPVLNPYWHSQDDAFFDIAESIRKIIEELQLQAKIKLEQAKAEKEKKLKQIKAEELLAKGEALYNEKRYKEAIADYTQAIDLNPIHALSYYHRGVAYFHIREYYWAATDYSKVISLDPTYTPAYAGRGDTYYHFGKYKQAVADYTQAISLDPTYAPAYVGRGGAYNQLHHYYEAIADYDQALALNYNYSDNIKYWRERAIRKLRS